MFGAPADKIIEVSKPWWARQTGFCAVLLCCSSLPFSLPLNRVVHAGGRNLLEQDKTAAAAAGKQAAEQGVAELRLNKPITEEIRRGKRRAYAVTLGAGSYVEVVAEQKGADVKVVLRNPGGEAVLTVDSPNGTEGPETVSWITKTSGKYTVEIEPTEKDAAPGKYEVRIETLRRAGPLDEERVRATVTMAEAEIASNETAEGSSARAAEKFKEAVQLLRKIKDSYRESLATRGACAELENSGRYAEALEYCQSAVQTAEAQKDTAGQAPWKFRLGMALEEAGQKESARTKYEESASRYAELGNKSGEARVLSRLSKLRIDLEQLKEAQGSLERELQLREAMGDEKGKALCLNRLGYVYRSLKQDDKVVPTHTAAMEAARKGGDKGQEALALDYLGDFHAKGGDFQKATDEFQKELKLRQEIKDKAGEADAYLGLASVCEAQRYHPGGDACREERRANLASALQAAREAKATHKQAYILWVIGSSSDVAAPVFNKMTDAHRERVRAAREALIQSKELYASSGTPQEVARCWNDMAKLDEQLDDVKSVTTDLQSAIAIYRKSGWTVDQSDAQKHLAKTYFRQKEYAKAEAVHGELKELWAAKKNAKETGLAIAGQGQMELAQGNAAEAVKVFEAALAAFGEQGDVHGRAEVHRFLGVAYLKLGQDDKALAEFNREYLLMRKDSLDVLKFLDKIEANQIWDPDFTARQKEILAEPALTSLTAVWDWFAFASFTNWDDPYFIDIAREAFRSRKLLQADDSLNLTTVLQLYMELAFANEHLKALLRQNELLKKALAEKTGEKPKEAPANPVEDLNAKAKKLQSDGEMNMRRHSSESAVALYTQALEIRRKLGDAKDTAQTLTSLGEAWLTLNQGEKSLAAYREAREQWHKAGSVKEEGEALVLIGVAYNWLGERQKALASYEEALQLAKAQHFPETEAGALFRTGETYLLLGEKKTALDNLMAARERSRNDSHPNGDGTILALIGFTYSSLGDTTDSLEYYKQAITEFDRASTGNLFFFDMKKKGRLYNQLGDAYYAIGDTDKALKTFQKGLIIQRNFGSLGEQAYALEKIGVITLAGGSADEQQRAMESFEKSLELTRTSGNPGREAEALHNLARAYEQRGDRTRALALYGQALAIRARLKDPEGQGETLDRLMRLWKSMNQPALAAFYGKQAVNMYQQIRLNMQGIGEDLQKSYVGSHSGTYRELADTLIAQGRIPEAQQVLDLLKNEEYLNFVRRDGAEEMSGVADYSSSESNALKSFNSVQDHIMRTGQRYAALSTKENLNVSEKAEFAKLEKELVTANQAYDKYLAALPEQFAVRAQGEARAEALREAKGLQETLRELGSGTVALYTVVTEDRYHVILITSETQKPFTYEIKAAELSRKVQEFRNVLMNPRVDPVPKARELYKIVVGPAEAALNDAQAKTLMWSLDGVLRYLPIAALHDGDQYLVEKYDLTIFTPASHSRLERPALAKWRGLGLGVSKGANPLPNVPGELHGVIHDETDAGSDKGVVAGKILLDDAFTKDAMKDALLHGKGYSLVHVASHFRFKPGNEYDSYLLLGGTEQASDDKRHLSLAEIKSGTNIFRGVDLLTLSACNTAVGAGEGSEVENFAVLAQRQGARAVIATLWPVADVSTMYLMQEFYRLHDSEPGTSKVESLREAQLSLLHGCTGKGCGHLVAASEKKPAGSGNGDAGGSQVSEFHADPRAPYAHPYFWAPFVLIGNWR